MKHLRPTAAAALLALLLMVFSPAAPSFASWSAERARLTVSSPAAVSAAAAAYDREHPSTEETGPFAFGRIVVFTDYLPENYGADRVVACPAYGEYVLQYDSAARAEAAYLRLRLRYSEAECWPDHPVAVQSCSVGWGSATMGMEGVLRAGYPVGDGLIAVIDSGVDASHPDLRGRISAYSYNFVNGNRTISDYDEEGGPGHGTSVASVLADCTPDSVQILMLKIYDRAGYASSLDFADAMLYAMECGACVVNMSIGVDDEADTEWDVPLSKLRAAGIPFISAAGNDGKNVSSTYPAYSPYTIAVSSVSESLRFSDYSNFGAAIDFCAPGENVIAADSSTGGYAYVSGTSISAPYVAAAAAYVKLLHPSYSVDQVYAMLRAYALDLGDPGWDSACGWGMPVLSGLFAEEFPSRAEVLLCGSADERNGAIVLTSPLMNQRGMASWVRPIDVSPGFRVSLEFCAEAGTPIPADGMAVMFTGTPGTPPGDLGGSGLNLRGDTDMLAVALDSFVSDGRGLPEKQIRLVRQSSGNVLASSGRCEAVCDGAWHTLEIAGTLHSLSVSLDGTPLLSSDGLMLPQTLYLSVSGTTGSFTSRQQVRSVRFSSAAAAQTRRFYDVLPGAFYTEAVEWAVRTGVAGGVAERIFEPDAGCTRAQAVTFLWRAADSPAPQSAASPFADVPADAFYADAVLWAVENGIVSGVTEDSFAPELVCTRAQIAAFLYRACGTLPLGGNPFSDVPDSAYYVDAVRWAAENGVTSGTAPGRFSPHAECTRAQIVTFLYRAEGLAA